MSIESVRAYLAPFGVADKIQELDTSSATVELAAKALGCKPERIAKTMSFRAGEQILLIVCAGDVKIDNAKYKAQFGKKAAMLHRDEVESLIGHDVGGVCPFAIHDGVDVYLDDSLKRFDIVYPACGTSNSAIGLTLEELALCSKCKAWIDVCKPIQNEE